MKWLLIISRMNNMMEHSYRRHSGVARDPRATLFTAPLMITGWIGHPLLVGLPIALATWRFMSVRP